MKPETSFWKFEARNPKYETNYNDGNTNVQQNDFNNVFRAKTPRPQRMKSEFRISKSETISKFE